MNNQKKNPTRIKNYHHKNTNSNSLQKKKKPSFPSRQITFYSRENGMIDHANYFSMRFASKEGEHVDSGNEDDTSYS